jgi:hypothetical protein
VISVTRMPASPCPNCGTSLDACTGASIASTPGVMPNRPVPKPGSVTICVECGALLTFDSQMRLRNPTPEMEQRFHAEMYPLLRDLQEWARSRRKTKNAPRSLASKR